MRLAALITAFDRVRTPPLGLRAATLALGSACLPHIPTATLGSHMLLHTDRGALRQLRQPSS